MRIMGDRIVDEGAAHGEAKTGFIIKKANFDSVSFKLADQPMNERALNAFQRDFETVNGLLARRCAVSLNHFEKGMHRRFDKGIPRSKPCRRKIGIDDRGSARGHIRGEYIQRLNRSGFSRKKVDTHPPLDRGFLKDKICFLVKKKRVGVDGRHSPFHFPICGDEGGALKGFSAISFDGLHQGGGFCLLFRKTLAIKNGDSPAFERSGKKSAWTNGNIVWDSKDI